MQMSQDNSFFRALRVQARVIGALMMWEVVSRFGRDNLGFIWLFLEPMIFTLSITALWSAISLTHGLDLPIVAFALTGYSSILLWRNTANRCVEAVQKNAGLLYHKPVRVLDVLLTKILLEIAGASMSFIGLGALWISIGWAAPPENVLAIIGGWLMLCWLGTGLALTIGALTSFSEIAERLWHPISYILFPLSGAGFMVEWLASDFREVIMWVPTVHCIELIREGFFGTVVRTHYDMTYVAMVSMVLTLTGLVLVRAAARRVEFL